MSRIRTIKPEFWKGIQEPWGGARSKLYIIQEDNSGPVKIGVAGHPARRLSSLQCGNSRRLFLARIYEGSSATCLVVESFLLRRFASKSLLGEWLSIRLDDIDNTIHPFIEKEDA